jgi:hypothetical protein
MTSDQQHELFTRWWPEACRAQGWNRNDRALRIQKVGEIVGRPITSCCDLENTRDFDALIPELLRLARPDSLKAAVDAVDASVKGECRRHIHLIEPLIEELDGHFGHNYIDAILSRRFKMTRQEWRNLPPEKLRQLLSTVNARAQIYRREKIEVPQ